MARIRGKKALYEVISNSRAKPKHSKILEPLHQEKSTTVEPTIAKSDTVSPAKTSQWRRKPQMIQVNANRIELSIPYQLGIALVLCLVLLLLVMFRLGQFSQKAANLSAQMRQGGRSEQASSTSVDMSQTHDLGEKVLPGSEKNKPAESKADHVIVIVRFLRQKDLEPVKQYFAQNGIETEIFQQGGWFYLVTKNMYENPEMSGTDGFKMKQRIINIGAKYKASKGYETFAPYFFKDAYGKKVR